MKTDKDEIEYRIDIVYASINRWERWLEKEELPSFITKEYILSQIYKENEALKILKDKHPEYFI